MTASNTLDGRYELGEVLGSGGMATVYRGTDRVLNRPVAVKVLSPEYAGDGDFVGRFRREAQAAAKLNDPGVVAVYDSGSDGGRHYIVMELVEGTTLADQLAEDGSVDPRRAAQIAERVAAALQFAHDNGLVHRDIKPGNVMLTPSGDVKVMDFGIARATGADTFTRTSSVLGTVAYLAPEQAESRPVDARTDVYALGVVLYEMLTGKPPFAGETAVAVAYKHVREQPVPPTRSNPEVPAPLEAITLKALAKDPADRYQSAEEMRDDLARAAAGAPVATTMLGATAPMGATAPTGATEQMGAPDSTMAMPPIDKTSVMEPTAVHEAPPEPPRERRRIWPIVVAAAIVIAVAALAIALLAGGGGGGPAPRGTSSPSSHPSSRPSTPSVQPSTPASPSPSPPPPSSPPPSPASSPPATPSVPVTATPSVSPISSSSPSP